MKVAVIGSGHLADATRTECAVHFEGVTSYAEADLAWFCVDTPVDEEDVPDVEYVHDRLEGFLSGQIVSGTPILVSSQLPVGTMRKWADEFSDHCLYYQPENIRKEHAIADFHFQNRIIVGINTVDGGKVWMDIRDHKTLIESVLKKFTPGPIYWMSYESAEMVKHALNTYLAMNIAYANEIADICELVGADVDDVFRGFRSDRRVGSQSPLQPGGPYTGGTLGRDVIVLQATFASTDVDSSIINAISQSNRARILNLDWIGRPR